MHWVADNDADAKARESRVGDAFSAGASSVAILPGTAVSGNFRNSAMRILGRRHLLACAAALAIAGGARADYPDKTITFVVPFAAGSATDQLARAHRHCGRAASKWHRSRRDPPLRTAPARRAAVRLRRCARRRRDHLARARRAREVAVVGAPRNGHRALAQRQVPHRGGLACSRLERTAQGASATSIRRTEVPAPRSGRTEVSAAARILEAPDRRGNHMLRQPEDDLREIDREGDRSEEDHVDRKRGA